ncbi:Endoplasmic reticulum zinc transporter [Actinomortierella ambigua]|nr:Endoplasmic reticulum zinc transporter [Actinomortierella ambigua]
MIILVMTTAMGTTTTTSIITTFTTTGMGMIIATAILITTITLIATGMIMVTPITTGMIMATITMATIITTITTIIVVHTDGRFKKSTVRYPFGVQRIEVLFGLSNAIFLLFIGMNMLKESLEHMMLEGDHHGAGDHHDATVRIPLFWTILGLGATLVGAIGYQNHKQFCLLLQAGSGHGGTWASAAAYNQKTLSLLHNQYSLATLACVAGVMLVWLLPAVDSLDNMVAIAQSVVMFALGGPLTKVLGMILLQTTPPMALEGVEDAVRQLASTDGSILGLDRSHVWANTYGQLVGTLVVRIAKEADEAATLRTIQQRLFSTLDVDPHAPGAGELTTSPLKLQVQLQYLELLDIAQPSEACHMNLLLKIKPSVSEEQAKEILQKLANLEKQLPHLVKSVHLGTNFASRAKGFTHGFTMIFESKEALETYDKSPEHVKVVTEDVRPNVDDVLAFDYEILPFSSASYL